MVIKKPRIPRRFRKPRELQASRMRACHRPVKVESIEINTDRENQTPQNQRLNKQALANFDDPRCIVANASRKATTDGKKLCCLQPIRNTEGTLVGCRQGSRLMNVRTIPGVFMQRYPDASLEKVEFTKDYHALIALESMLKRDLSAADPGKKKNSHVAHV